MDVGSANQAQSAQFLVSSSGDVDGEAVIMALSLSKAETASESVKASVQSLNQANTTSKFLHGFYDKFDELVDQAVSRLDDAIKTVDSAISSVVDTIKDLTSEIQNIAQKIADKVVPDIEPAKSVAKAIIGDWESDKEKLESQKSEKESKKQSLEGKKSDLKGGQADNPHVREVLGDNLGMGDEPEVLANYGVTVDTTSVDKAKESLPAIAEATRTFDAKADTARKQLKSTVAQLTAAVRDLGGLVSSLRQSGNESLQSLAETQSSSREETDTLFRELAEQAANDDALRDALQALSEYDSLKTQFGIPDDAASIVTGRLTQTQQEDVGRQLQEWLQESQRDATQGTELPRSGIRTLEQQAKRIRV